MEQKKIAIHVYRAANSPSLVTLAETVATRMKLRFERTAQSVRIVAYSAQINEFIDYFEGRLVFQREAFVTLQIGQFIECVEDRLLP